MTQRPKITVIGSVNADFVIETETLPRPGETVGGGTFEILPGGKGANQALAAQRLGGAVSFIANVGDDAVSASVLGNLREAGVDLSKVNRQDGIATGAAFIVVDQDGENQIAIAPGANATLAADPISDKTADAVIAQLEVPEPATLEAISESDVFFCLNAAPAIEVSKGLLDRVDLLVVNETELAFYEKKLPDFRGLIAVTYGANGAALYQAGKELAKARPPKVDVVDTTGAGDTFTGALVVALKEGKSYQDALVFACVAGALATTKLGAQTAMPTRDALEQLIA